MAKRDAAPSAHGTRRSPERLEYAPQCVRSPDAHGRTAYSPMTLARHDAYASPRDASLKRSTLSTEYGYERLLAPPSQRRESDALPKAPRLSFDAQEPSPALLRMLPGHGLEPRSAPPHQHQFGPESRRASSSYWPGHDREGRRMPPLDAYEEGGPPPPTHPEPSAAHRAYPSRMPSPSYHTSHVGARHDAGYPPGEADPETPSLRSPHDSKAQFLSLFSDFFDTLSDSRTLKATLEYQIRSSNALLQTLQRGSKVFDETVDRRLQQESEAWQTRFTHLEKQIDRMDARMDEVLSTLQARAPSPP